MFQSLLSWISLFDGRRRSLSREAAQVSILVVLDQPLRRGDEEPREQQEEFQSLLSWISLFDLCKFYIIILYFTVSILVVLDQPLRLSRALLPYRLVTSFNPCCPGSASSTQEPDHKPHDYHLFQSLLSWISLFDKHDAILKRLRDYVSILVVLDQPLRQRAGNQNNYYT